MSEELEVVTVWVTTYALTKGILVADDAEVCSATMIASKRLGYHHGNDWHRTEAAAIARAEEMRVAKIASLERQIAKLRKLTFAAHRGGKARTR